MSEYEETEEEEETYIDPKDIEMIENPNQWRPSKQQILAYALKIGYDPERDPEEFLQIAEEYLLQPLPNEWRRAFRKDDSQIMYIDLTTNEIHLFTDIEEKAKADLEEERALYQEQLREEQEKSKQVTVVPRKKIPPIGGKAAKEDPNKIREKEIIEKMTKSKGSYEDEETRQLKEKIIKDQQKERFIEQDLKKSEVNASKAKESNLELHLQDNEDSDKDDTFKKPSDTNSEINNSQPKINQKMNKHVSNQKEVYEDDAAISRYKQQHKKNFIHESEDEETEKEHTRTINLNANYEQDQYQDLGEDSEKEKVKEKDKDEDKEEDKKKEIKDDDEENIQPSHPKVYKTPEQRKREESLQNSAKLSATRNIEKEKSKYLEEAKQKLAELKRQADTFSTIKSEIKSEFQESFDKRMQDLKKKLLQEYQEKEKKLREKLEEDLTSSKEAYKNEFERVQPFDKNYSSDQNKDISDLIAKKEDLLDDINRQKQRNETNLKKKKEVNASKLQKEKYIQDEKKKMRINSINNQFNIRVMQLERDLEEKYEKDKKNIQLNLKESAKLIEDPNFSVGYNELIKEYQKTLDQEFEMKKEEIKKELKEKQRKDLENYRQISGGESTDKVNYITSQTLNLEKDYYSELSEMRAKNEQAQAISESQLVNKIGKVSSLFETMKKDTETVLSNEIRQIIINVQHFIRNEKDDNSLPQTEEKLLEFIESRLSENLIKLNKVKSLYEITEKEYKKVRNLLDYFIDVIKFLNNQVVVNSLIEGGKKGEDEQIVSKSLQFGQTKRAEFHEKMLESSKEKIFPFLDFYYNNSGLEKNNIQYELFNMVKPQGYGLPNSSNNNIHTFYSQDRIGPNPMNNMQTSQGSFAPNQTFNNINMNSNQDQMNFSFLSPSNRNSQNIQSTQMGYPNQGFSLCYPPKMDTSEREVALSNMRANLNAKIESTRYQGTNLDSSNAARFQVPQEEMMSTQQYQIKQDLPSLQSTTTTRGYSLKLPNEITHELSDDDFKRYNTIIDFLYSEEAFLAKERQIILHRKNLNSKLDEINREGDLMEYSQAFNEERMITIRQEKYYMNKLETFEIIKAHTDEVFKFIIENSKRKEIFKDKFNLIINHINDYNKTFTKKGQSLYSMEPVNSISFGVQQQMKPAQNNINIGNMNSSFTNFYSLYSPNRLSRQINTEYSHKFFNYKKNQSQADYKVASTANSISDSNPRRHFYSSKENTFY